QRPRGGHRGHHRLRALLLGRLAHWRDPETHYGLTWGLDGDHGRRDSAGWWGTAAHYPGRCRAHRRARGPDPLHQIRLGRGAQEDERVWQRGATHLRDVWRAVWHDSRHGDARTRPRLPKDGAHVGPVQGHRYGDHWRGARATRRSV